MKQSDYTGRGIGVAILDTGERVIILSNRYFITTAAESIEYNHVDDEGVTNPIVSKIK